MFQVVMISWHVYTNEQYIQAEKEVHGDEAYVEAHDAELEEGPKLLGKLRCISVDVLALYQLHESQQEGVLGSWQTLQRLRAFVHCNDHPAVEGKTSEVPRCHIWGTRVTTRTRRLHTLH